MVCLISNLLDCVQNLMGKLLTSDLKQFMLLKSLTENIQEDIIQILRHIMEVACDEYSVVIQLNAIAFLGSLFLK